MKILMASTNFQAPVIGGGQVVLKTLAESLVARGHEVSVAAIAHDRPEVRKVGAITVHYLPARNLYRPMDAVKAKAPARLAWHGLDMYNPFTARDFKRVCDREKPDVIHSHVLSGFSVSAWRVAGSLGLPIVHSLHDQYLQCPRSTMFRDGRNCMAQCWSCRGMRIFHRFASSSLSGVVGVSRFILDRHLERGYFRDVTIRRVIHNVCDTAELGTETAAVRELADPLRIGFIGRIDPTKGVQRLLDAFTAADLPHAELWIAGSGNADYEQPLRVRHASERVRFLGRVAPRDFYPHVDIVVVPSLWHEPFGMVVAEALAFGKPVIGSRRGGIPEMIRAGENGFLFEPDRPEELVAALQQLASDATLRARLSEAARASARPFMDRDRWSAQYLALYQRIAHRRAVSSSPPNKECP